MSTFCSPTGWRRWTSEGQERTGGDSWQPVLDRLTVDARVFTYDRPGTGSAPPRTAPNLALPYSAFAAELETLLDQERIDGPLVVVGHSFGSLIARMFASRNPHRIAGMVHVDGSIPRGVLWPPIDWPPSPDGDGPGATAVDKFAGEVEILEAEYPLVPAVVVTRTPGRLYPGYPPEVDTLWFGYQRLLARQLDAPLVFAADATHQVPAESPDLVAYVVDQVAAAGWAPVTLDVRQLDDVGGRLMDSRLTQ